MSDIIQAKWRATVQNFAKSGFLDRQSRNQKILEALVTTYLPQSSSHAFVISLKYYLKRCEVVGAPLSLQGLNPRPFSLNEPLRSNDNDGNNNVIVSIRGSPRLQFVQEIGKRLQSMGIPPQLLLNHLPFPNCHRIRPLDSERLASFTVCMVSLGQYGVVENTKMSIKDQQRIIDKSTGSHNITKLGEGHGAEQCRKVTIYGPGYFSVEQEITFIPYDIAKHTWSGVILNDSGKHCNTTPWYQSNPNMQAQFLPTIRVGTRTLGRNDRWQAQQQPVPDPCESRARHEAMVPLHSQSCFQDPFAFLADLLDTSALSWTNFLSSMEGEEYVHYQDVYVDAENRVDILRNLKQVLDSANIYFDTVLELLDQRESSLLAWPTASTTTQSHVDGIAKHLRSDFVQLRSRSMQLSQTHMQSIQIEMSSISILESKKGLEEAARVGQVTFLAFVFIPMTFISSVFGMNVTVFTSPGPPLWKFFAVAVPFTLVCLSAPFWQHIWSLFRVCHGKFRKWRGFHENYDLSRYSYQQDKQLFNLKFRNHNSLPMKPKKTNDLRRPVLRS